jgi:hypothetical protein
MVPAGIRLDRLGYRLTGTVRFQLLLMETPMRILHVHLVMDGGLG